MAIEPQRPGSLRAHRRSPSWPAVATAAILVHVLVLLLARTIATALPVEAHPIAAAPEASTLVELALDEPAPPQPQKPHEAPVSAERPAPAKVRGPRRAVSSGASTRAAPPPAVPTPAAPSSNEAGPAGQERGAAEGDAAPPSADVHASARGTPERLYGPRKGPPNPTAEGLTALLRDSLEQSDRDLGLGRGALISAAESYDVRTLVPAGESVATIVVDVDAQGAAIAANVGTVTAHRGAWDRIAETMLASLRGRTIGRPGALRPTRFTVRVDVRVRLPSGARKLGECLPGQDGVVCFDLSDIGAHHTLQIHARVVGEEQR
ncbi:Hypothetical protein A7982_03547 [Minicystis rosea]|nr:Hypothetical protein A7982_03547 [Minicystis rosea]